MPYAKPLAGVCAATALFVCGAAGFPVPPDTMPASEGTLSLGNSGSTVATFTPGASVEVTGGGFADDASVTVAVYSTPRRLATTAADSTGHLDTTVTLPTDLTGDHTLVALGVAPDGSSHTVEAPVTIETPANEIATLAYTGMDAAAMGAGGLGLLLCGFVLVRTKRYRRPLLPTR